MQGTADDGLVPDGLLPQRQRGHTGFSLLELAVVMIVAGVLIAGAASALDVHLRQQRVATTNDRLQQISDAIDLYFEDAGLYPCVASLTAQKDTAAYAVASDCAGANPAGTFDVAGRPGTTIRIGAVPGRTLGLPDEVTTDGWGNRVVFAVTRSQAAVVPFDPGAGGVSIRDPNGNEIPPAAPGTNHYVLISHGPDSTGSYGSNATGVAAACPAINNTEDAENCDHGNGAFVYTSQRNAVVGAAHYDDYLSFKKGPAGAPPPPPAAFPFLRYVGAYCSGEGCVATANCPAEMTVGAGATCRDNCPPDGLAIGAMTGACVGDTSCSSTPNGNPPTAGIGILCVK